MRFSNLFSFLKLKPKDRHLHHYYGLADNSTGALLILDHDFKYVSMLRELFPDTSFLSVPSITEAHQRFFNSLTPEKFYLLKWNSAKDAFVMNSEDLDRLEILSVLVCAKYEVLKDISKKLGILRQRLRKHVFLQDIIYMQKSIEAQDFKRAGYPESNILEYPYILQYADMAEISVREATDRILLKSALEHDMLAKTESLRIRSMNSLKDAETVDEVERTHREFLLDYDVRI